MIAFNTALSGLNASLMRFDASAANIAAAGTTGPVGGSGDYRPVDTVSTAQSGGGVATSLAARQPASVQEYDPASPDAGSDGMVATPNVNTADEGVTQLEALLTYQANLSVVRASDAMARSTINLTA